jgi:hypothetical protein
VSAVFEKLGYDPEVGVEIFNSVCEGLARRKREEGRDRARSGAETESDSELSAIVAAAVVTETPPMSEEGDGFDDRIDHRMSLDDFITAALEVDDSLIQAIQLVSRKRLFRTLKQQGGGRIATNPTAPSELEAVSSSQPQGGKEDVSEV